MSNNKCPVCKIPLSINNIDRDYKNQYCISCRREFYPIRDDERQKSILDLQSDLETVSSESGSSSPILLSSEEDLRFWPKEYKKRKENYLQKYFPSE